MLTGVDHPWIVIVCVVIVLVAVLVALRRPRYPESGPVKSGLLASGPVTLPDDVRAEVDRLVAAGQKIQAIKVLRTAVPGLSLKDGKDLVDGRPVHRGGQADPGDQGRAAAHGLGAARGQGVGRRASREPLTRGNGHGQRLRT